MSQSSYAPPPKPANAMNTMGLIGLVMSIAGFVTFITAPIGLVMSLAGLKHPDKGLAIAGTIVGIFSTLWAAVWTLLAVVYFGAIGAIFGTMCCMMSSLTSMAAEQLQQEQAVAAAATAELGRQAAVHNLSVTGAGDSRQAAGTAVYTGEDFKQMAVEFTCQLDKISGEWEASNFQSQTAPYEWSPPGFDPSGGSPGPGDDGAADVDETVSEPEASR